MIKMQSLARRYKKHRAESVCLDDIQEIDTHVISFYKDNVFCYNDVDRYQLKLAMTQRQFEVLKEGLL